MKHIPKLILLLILSACATACATSNGTSGDSTLMGLDDRPAKAVWEDWTPEPNNQSTDHLVPQVFIDQVVAFDYWQIGDDEFVNEGWTGVSAVLDYVRREGLSEAQDNTATLLLQALDSRQPPEKTLMDVTYVVSLDQDEQLSEGLVVRVYAPLEDKGVTPGAAIYLGRDVGSAGGFDRAVVWAVPGFAEAEAFTVDLEKTDAGWSAHRVGGAVYPADEAALPDERVSSLDSANELTREILTTRFWEPLTQVGYVEAKPMAEGETGLPPRLQPALGMELRERQLEEIYSDTVFPPRDEVPPMGNTEF
jgi:hypothetical protein